MAQSRVVADRYHLRREVGQGGTGVVYEAWDRELERRVAVKVLHERVGMSAAEEAGRLRREVRALGRVNHPAVVSLYDAGITEQRPYLVMEWLDGLDLARLRAALGWRLRDLAAALTLPLVEGLRAIHEAGVLHRDIKPSNIRVTHAGRVVLCDLGLARISGDTSLTRSGVIVGTPRYMAPEMIRGEAPTPASDYYALGLCLREVLTDQQVFAEHENAATLLWTAVNEGVEPVDAPSLAGSVPGGLVDLVNGWCARDPAQRPTATDAALEVLTAEAPVRSLGGLIAMVEDDGEPLALEIPGSLDGPLVPGGSSPDPQPAPADARRDRTLSGSFPAPSSMLSLGDVTQALVLHRITPRNAVSRLREAVGMVQRGEHREALDLLATIGTVGAERLGPGDPTTLTARFWHAVCLARLGSGEEALALLATVNAHTEPVTPPDDGEPAPASGSAPAPAPEENEKGDPE
ncbi:protein kinase [Streptomyces sp. 3MP-14]|uniref:non-specific serine/threonine protein kinase n=1 Tax=Streptomyces mimosae TaxID=2586635 RepID=A0A5N6A253_9ACTN|nr:MULTISPECIES: serine/threonine-protein kinase [Streptomyces]KAB8162844.1 protein kinase [Streptomyces mimosae]KAB8179057.1 protein kinase [Streptomyces sp. 3MP-14]